MRKTSNINNVLILAGDAEGNLGDRAILQATCGELLSIKSTLQISIISRNKNLLGDMKNIHVIKPGPGGFFQLLHAARYADIVLCGGGGLFQDDDSLIKMPYWALRLLLVRIFCNNIVGYALGVGPLSAPTSRLSARIAFACMKRISVRDPIALDTAQPLTGKNVTVVPDPALLLEALPEQKAKDFLLARGVNNQGRPLIGVAVRRWFPAKPRIIPNKISAKFRSKNETAVKQSEQLCTLLANVLDQLVIKHDAHIIFMPSYTVSHESDDKLCLDIQQRMKTDVGTLLHVDTPQLYKAISSQLSVLLCGRMHPSIFAAASGTPIVGLAYNPKFYGFFSLLKLERQVMDVNEFVNHNLADELAELTTSVITDAVLTGSTLTEQAPTAPLETTEKMAKIKNDIYSFNRLIMNMSPEIPSEVSQALSSEMSAELEH